MQIGHCCPAVELILRGTDGKIYKSICGLQLYYRDKTKKWGCDNGHYFSEVAIPRYPDPDEEE